MPGKPTILIAEDDVNLSEILKSKLASLGYDVTLAHDGEDAEKGIAQTQPDLSLLDIMMPKKSGVEVLESVMKKPATKDLTYFMLSNLGQKKDIDHALTVGAKDYIVKSNSSLAEIVQKIDQYLKAHPPKERPILAAAPEPAQEEKPAEPAVPAAAAEPAPPQQAQQYPPMQFPTPMMAPYGMPFGQPSFLPYLPPYPCYFIPVYFSPGMPMPNAVQMPPMQNGQQNGNGKK